MSYTVFAVVAALVLLWHSSVAVDDRKNSLGNRKPSVLADDVYEALVNLAEGKSLPPVKERTEAIRTATEDIGEPRVRYRSKTTTGNKLFITRVVVC